MSETRNYIFAGNEVTITQFLLWRREQERGLCPFCHEARSKRYGGIRRHVMACKSNPRNKADGYKGGQCPA